MTAWQLHVLKVSVVIALVIFISIPLVLPVIAFTTAREFLRRKTRS